MSLRQIAAVALLAVASFTTAATSDGKGVQKPAEQAVYGSDTVAGCFSSLADMELLTTDKFNSQGFCARRCRNNSMPVGATYLKACYCGTKLPNAKTLLKDTKCNEPCPGYDPEACGGLNAYTVYNTGVQVQVAEAELDTTSSTTTTAASSTTSTSQTSATNVQTTPAESQKPSEDDSGSKTNTVGIAVGVVVGVLVAAAIAGGAFFYLRKKRNSDMEEEHRRNAAVNAFISGGKPPRSSSGASIADSRMDPVMNRRMSDGSIADNQDYSRRILRVTNA